MARKKADLRNTGFGSILLPPYLVMNELLDLPHDINTLVLAIHQNTDTALPLDKKTLRNTAKTPVTTKTTGKIESYMKGNVDTKHLELAGSIIKQNPLYEYTLFQNCFSWDILYQKNLEFMQHQPRLKLFLHSRIKAERNLLKAIQASRSDAYKLKLIEAALLEETKLDSKKINIIIDQLQADTSDHTASNRLALFELLTDFIYQALVLLEFDARDIHILNNRDMSKFKDAGGVISAVMPYEASTIPLKRIFINFTEKLGISINKLANYMPYTPDKDREPEDVFENNRRMLREWNSGKTTPSDEKLFAFMKNIINSEESDEHINLFWLCKLAIGIGKLQKELNAICLQNDEIESIFGKYKIYYDILKSETT